MKYKIFLVMNEDRFLLTHRLPVALAARRAGYEVTVVGKDTGKRSQIEKYGLRYVEMPVNPTGTNVLEDFNTLRFLVNLYRSERPDVAHHIGLKCMLWGGIAAKLCQVPSVISAVSGLGNIFSQGDSTFLAKAILGVLRYTYRRPGVKVIFQNTDDADIFRSHRMISEEHIHFTHGSGVDLSEFMYRPEPAEGRLKIIFTARMLREKGVEDLIEAARILKPAYGDRVQFLLCGRLAPNSGPITRKYLQNHCDGKYLVYMGERDDVQTLLENSHIMAFPSYYREGLPKSLIEACAIGRPIVTCDSTGCRDTVDDGVNGFLVPPRSPEALASRLELLINDPELRKRMGRASREKAERCFSIDDVVDTHMKLYAELTAGLTSPAVASAQL